VYVLQCVFVCVCVKMTHGTAAEMMHKLLTIMFVSGSAD